MGTNVLIALVGMSPAVVTETFWALAHRGHALDKRFIPDRIVLVTTGSGRDIVEDRLLRPPPNAARSVMQRLVDQEGLPAGCARLGDGLEIRCVTGAGGHEYADAHEVDELAELGDLVFETVREFTQDVDSTVCVSLSGGRKTMGYLAGLCLSLLGRPQDRLLHVLVHPKELEACPDFYFPERAVESYETAGGADGALPRHIDVDKISVRLSDVPFVQLANLPGLRERVRLFSDAGLSGVIAATNSVGEIPVLELRLDSSTGKIWLGAQDLTAYRDPNGARLISSLACMTLLHFIGRENGFGLTDLESTTEAPAGRPTGHDLLLSFYRHWLRLELIRNLPFKAEEWFRRLSACWRPRVARPPADFSAQHILEEPGFTALFVPRPGTMSDEWDDLKVHLSKLRRAMRLALDHRYPNPELYMIQRPGRGNRVRLPPSLRLTERKWSA